ncbi:putative polysaccharide biosynthesis protein [Paenibacillus sp. CMAA1364]
MVKKESFVKGTLILAAAALIARVLGLAQRVPLEHMLGDVGNASFTIANNIYLMLLTIATAGIPSTLSKMVSERYALEKPHEAQRIYHAALIFSAVMGVLMTIILYVSAPYYAANTHTPEATLAIRTLAPALLLFPTIAMMRGYFQGRNNMMAGGISQIVEQIARVGTALVLAYILLQMDYDDSLIAAGASFGGVFGSVGAFAVMLYFTYKLRKQDRDVTLLDTQGSSLPMIRIYKDIFALSIPIVLTSLAVPAVNFIDSSIIKDLLIGQSGDAYATQVLAIIGSRAQPVAGIPPILAIALSTSLIPIISAAFARRDQSYLKQQITLAMRIAILTGMPLVIALCVASYSVNGLLFSTLDGSGIIMLLTFGTIFQITMMTSNSILLGVSKAKVSMINVMIGVVVKLVGSYALAPFLGIYGIIAATGLCFLVITLLNLRVLKVIVPFTILGKRWVNFVITIAISAGVGFGLNQAGIQLVHIMPARLAFLITCLVVGMAVVVIYLVLLIVLGVLHHDELSSYPRMLQRVFRPLMRLQPRRIRNRSNHE